MLKIWKELVSLPLFPDLKKNQVKYIIKVIKYLIIIIKSFLNYESSYSVWRKGD